MTTATYYVGGIQAPAVRRSLGDLVGLKHRLSQAGPRNVLPPIVARHPETNMLTLIGGERRFAALRGPDDSIKVYVARYWREYLAWLLVDKAPEVDRKPMILLEAAAFAERVNDVLRPTVRDAALGTISEYLGYGYDHLRGAVYVLRRTHDDYPPEMRKLAHELMEMLNSGTLGTSAANDRLAKLARKLEQPPGMPAAQQRRALDSLVGMMAGVKAGLESLGELSPELEAQECAAWAEPLAGVRTQMEKMIKMLRERAR